MHHKSNFYIYFGIWVAVLPFIGVPGVWKMYLTFISGLVILLHASSPMIIKKLQSRTPRQRKKAVKNVGAVDQAGDLRFNEPEYKESVPGILEASNTNNTEEKV